MENSHNSSKLAPQTNPNGANNSDVPDPPSYEEATCGKPVSNFSPVLPTPTAPDCNDDSLSLNPAISYATHEPIFQQNIVRQIAVVSTERSKFSFGPNPINVVCPGCGVQDMSRISREPSTASYICSCILCLLGCWICILLKNCDDDSHHSTNDLDCCNDDCTTSDGCCMDTYHYCRNCNKFLGSYSD